MLRSLDYCRLTRGHAGPVIRRGLDGRRIVTPGWWPQDPPRPVPLCVPGVEEPFVATFADEPTLRQMMARLGVTGYRIKQIDDGREFSVSMLDGGWRFMDKPYFTAEGRIRYREVRWKDDWERYLSQQGIEEVR